MRARGSFRVPAVITLAALCASCVTTRLPPISSAGADFQPLKDETRLWESAYQEEKKLRDHISIYPDPLLEDYLGEVIGRLNPPGMAANDQLGYRVTVVEDPTLNAFAFPHAALYVHTGLLARMENESQLATVLAHEMTHVENRHMLRFQRSARNKQIGWSVAAVTAAVVLAGEEGEALEKGKYGKAARIGVLSDVLVGLGLQLAFVASINGYGRDLEREADEGAFGKMEASGYDLNEAPKVYRALLDDHGDPGKVEAFFFGSHPKLASRIESAEQWLAEHEASAPEASALPLPDPGEFERRIRPVIRDDARLNIEMGRLELADYQLARVADLMPDDPETHFLIGRLKLEMAGNRNDPEVRRALQEEGAAAFRESIRLDPDRPLPHRELGLLAYRGKDYRSACVQFRQYVELDPDAEDAQRMRDYVLELERDAQCP